MNIKETLGEFVKRIAAAIPCYHHQRKQNKVKSPESHPLKKNDTMTHGAMGHFATVYYRKKKDAFLIIAEKWLADQQGVLDADEVKPEAFGDNPGNPKHAGLLYYVKPGSIGGDYRKAVRALKAIRNNPNC